jgi:ubiquinone/menaquinone biosynthesis C-methylase UbiE
MAPHPHTHPHTPNHHKDHPGFAGVSGLVAALAIGARHGGDGRLVATLTGVGPLDTVVDVGCGPGGAVRHAAGRGATAIGVDPAAVMLRVARVLSAGRRRIRYLDGTAEALPVADGTATVLWSIATVHHWADIDAGLAEARRVLRPGGRLLAIERHSPPDAQGLAGHGWTEPQAAAFADACTALGFTGARVEPHTGGRGAVLAVLAAAPVVN